MDECPHFLSLLGSEVVEGELEDWLGDDDAVGLPPDAESEETRLCRLLAWARGRIIEVIRAKCHQCTSGAIDGISDCTSFTCALYPWRAGTAATVEAGFELAAELLRVEGGPLLASKAEELLARRDGSGCSSPTGQSPPGNGVDSKEGEGH